MSILIKKGSFIFIQQEGCLWLLVTPTLEDLPKILKFSTEMCFVNTHLKKFVANIPLKL